MDKCHNSTSHQFQLVAFSLPEEGQRFLFGGVLMIYLITVIGNVIITALVCLVPQLHTPMYFFLCNLSLSDVVYVSTTLPKLLYILLTQDKCICFSACITQVYFFGLSIVCEVFVLTSMSYDRYVAICKPLQYTLIMSSSICNTLATCCWLMPAILSLINTLDISRLAFCNTQNIDHYFCDVKALLTVTSSDVTHSKALLIFQDMLFGILTFSIILISYGYIISTIVKINSSERRLKAFSSCSSHLTTVVLFYGPVMTMYAKTESDQSKELDKLLSLTYVAIVPMLNPFVYTLRNADVLGAVKKIGRIKYI